MQSIDLKQLYQMDKDLRDLLEEVPERRKKLHDKIAVAIKEEVNTQISDSGLNDSSGHIKEWQEAHTGSGGGYAAVRATDKSTGDNSPGAITNYLENGHKIREPSGSGKNYRPQIHTPYVDGFHFYGLAEAGAESKAIEAAEEFVDEIVEKLEG